MAALNLRVTAPPAVALVQNLVKTKRKKPTAIYQKPRCYLGSCHLPKISILRSGCAIYHRYLLFFWAIYYFCDVYRGKDGGKLWLLVWAKFRVEMLWPMAVFVVVQTRNCFQSANLMLTPWIWGTCKPYLSALPLFCVATWLRARSWLSILPFGASGEQLPPAKEADTGQDKRTCAANIQGKLQKPAWWVAGRSSLASICRQDCARLSGGWDTYYLGRFWRCRSKVESGWIHFFPVGCCRRGGSFANVVSFSSVMHKFQWPYLVFQAISAPRCNRAVWAEEWSTEWM